MDRISNIERGLLYLHDPLLVNNITHELQNIKKDVTLAYLSPSKYRANKFEAQTTKIANKLNEKSQSSMPIDLAEKIGSIKLDGFTKETGETEVYECDCQQGTVLLEDEASNFLVCPKCNKVSNLKMGNTIYKVRSTNSGANRSKSLEVVYESLSMIQGLAPINSTSEGSNYNPVPGTSDYKIIMDRLEQEFPNRKLISSVNDVRRVIDNIPKRKHLKWSFYLYCVFTKSNPILMTSEEINFIISMYNHVLDLTTMIQSDSKGPHHIPRCSMILYRLIDICQIMDPLRKQKYLEVIDKPQLDTIRNFEKNFWKNICNTSIEHPPVITFYPYN